MNRHRAPTIRAPIRIDEVLRFPAAAKQFTADEQQAIECEYALRGCARDHHQRECDEGQPDRHRVLRCRRSISSRSLMTGLSGSGAAIVRTECFAVKTWCT